MSEAKNEDDGHAARMNAMFAAWHSWRAAIVRDMAARVAEVGDEPDDELADLQMEMDHCSAVADVLFSREYIEE